MAVDFETTGLRPGRGDRVIEVAVARGRYGTTPVVWSSLVNPEAPMGATHIHGITEDMVVNQPIFCAIAPTLLQHLDGAVPVAHHAGFDHAFLRMELKRIGQDCPTTPWLDTMGLARQFPWGSGRGLGRLCETFGVEHGQAHRAEADARATWVLAWRMMEALDPARNWTVDDAYLTAQRVGSESHKELREVLEQARADGLPLLIDYLNMGAADATRRLITVTRIKARMVVAWCHLRNAERTFRLERIRLVS